MNPQEILSDHLLQYLY